MIPKIIAGATTWFGKPKDWDEQRDGKCAQLGVRVTQDGLHESAWEPTAAELAVLNAGGYVVLSVLGHQPPVRLSVKPRS